jgi:hypothetical protein
MRSACQRRNCVLALRCMTTSSSLASKHRLDRFGSVTEEDK